MKHDVPDIQSRYFDNAERVVAIMSACIDGDIPALDTQADSNQLAIAWLPIATPDYQRLTQLILDGKVQAEPTWSQDGRILELLLVRV